MSVNVKLITGEEIGVKLTEGDKIGVNLGTFHNSLFGLQGGSQTERFHLTESEVGLIHQNTGDIATISGLLNNDQLTDIVFQTGDQTISGVKSFNEDVVFNADINSTGNINQTGNYNISGNVSINGGINNEALTVDGNISASGSISASEYLGLSAIDVAYDNTLHIDETHGLAATDVQNAIDELEYKKLNVADLRSNLMLFPTTASSTVSGYTDYGRLVTSTEDTDYNTTAVDIPTNEISGDDIPVGQLISDAGILEGNVGLVNITTIGNIRKTGVRNATFYFKVFKYNSTEDEVELCESNPVPEVTSTDYEQFSESALIPAGTTFTADDHIIIRYYGNRIGSGNTCTYEFQFGGDDPVRTLVPVPASTVVKSVWSKDTNDIYYNDGNVGIGTDSPTSKLDIRNGTSPSELRIYGTDDGAGNTAFASLTHNSSGDLTISTESTGTGTAGRVQVGLPAYAGAFSVIVNNNQVSPTGELAALIYNSASNLRASGLEVRAGVPSYRSYSFRALDRNAYPILVADGYKNVGIGTDEPASKLHIEGSGDDDATSSLNVTDNVMNSLLFVRDDGNVGIGTTSPDYRLDIGGGTASTSNTLRMVQADGGTAIRIGAGGANNDVTLLRVDGESSVNKGESDSSNFGFSLRYKGSGSGNGNSLAFFSDNQQAGSQVEALTILQDGKVGIGTTTPSSKLHIEGSGGTDATSSLNVTDSVANSLLFVRDDGNVGIGTDTPTAKLNVQDFALNGALGASGIDATFRTTSTGMTNVHGARVSCEQKAASGAQANFNGLVAEAILGSTNVTTDNTIGLKGTTNIKSPLNGTGDNFYGLVGSFLNGHFPNLNSATIAAVASTMTFDYNPASTNVNTKIAGFFSSFRGVRAGQLPMYAGFYFENPEGETTGSITDVYGLYLEEPTLGSARNFGVYSVGGDNYFGGNVGIGTSTPARKLHVSDVMRLEPTTAPASPATGDLYFDSSMNKLRCYDGTTWQDCF